MWAKFRMFIISSHMTRDINLHRYSPPSSLVSWGLLDVLYLGDMTSHPINQLAPGGHTDICTFR